MNSHDTAKQVDAMYNLAKSIRRNNDVGRLTIRPAIGPGSQSTHTVDEMEAMLHSIAKQISSGELSVTDMQFDRPVFERMTADRGIEYMPGAKEITLTVSRSGYRDIIQSL